VTRLEEPAVASAVFVPLARSELRQMAGLPEGSAVNEDDARRAGRRLARAELLSTPPTDGFDLLPHALASVDEVLAAFGVTTEIVRMRPGCAVMRVATDPGANDRSGCAVARGFLEVLPSRCGHWDAVLLETGCDGHDDGPCVCTLLWDRTADPSVPAPAATDGVPGSADQEWLDDDDLELVVPPRPASASALVALAPSSALDVAAPADSSLPQAPPVHQIRRRGGWFRRRWWILALAVVAGAAGGHFEAAHRVSSYTAGATLVVQSGASARGPGSANDAAALAITDATYIPTDQSVIQATSSLLGVPGSAVSGHFTMTAETGTAVMALSYSAPTAAEAVRGATTVARVVALGVGVPSGSVRIVRLPTTATHGSSIEKDIVPIGAVLGLVIGLIIVLAVERADPRLEDDRTVSDVAGCPTCTVVGAAGPSELAPVIARHPVDRDRVTLVPVTGAEAAEAEAMAAHLRHLWPTDRRVPEIVVGTEEGPGAVDLASTASSTVLVVGVGASRRALRSAAERLRLLGCPPLCAIFVDRPRRRIVAPSAR